MADIFPFKATVLYTVSVLLQIDGKNHTNDKKTSKIVQMYVITGKR
jgi:hypothetical protein